MFLIYNINCLIKNIDLKSKLKLESLNIKNRPYVLSIGGFDPSGGAGVLADIKTIEQFGGYGFGVITAVTVQNDIEFVSANWSKTDLIIKQIEILLKRFSIKYIKIGIIESVEVLKEILDYLYNNIKEPIIIFDPILKASAGFMFHNLKSGELNGIFEMVYCITPNLPEMVELFGESIVYSGNYNITNIYLKGGHNPVSDIVTDLLYLKGENECIEFKHSRLPNGEKHGSGCVLSSALTTQLALGLDLKIAAENAFNYTYKFLASNRTLLGYHNIV